MTPKTLKDEVAELAADVLKAATSARTDSVKVEGLEFADDLSQKLLTHCNAVEAKYKEVRKTIDKGASDGVLRAFKTTLESLDKATKKYQVGLQAFFVCSFNPSVSENLDNFPRPISHFPLAFKPAGHGTSLPPQPEAKEGQGQAEGCG